jgi:hypothetical protein
MNFFDSAACQTGLSIYSVHKLKVIKSYYIIAHQHRENERPEVLSIIESKREKGM